MTPIPSPIRDASERALRSTLLGLSRRRRLGRLATRTPVTRAMVARFVAGETLEEAVAALDGLRKAGFRTTVDLLGESVESPVAAESAARAYVETLDVLAERGLDRNVSLKLSQMGLALGRTVATANVRQIVDRAASLGGFVRIDMEDHATTDATLDVWRAVRPAAPVPSGAEVGVVIQAALRRSPADVDEIVALDGRIRLCKGAYREPASVAFVDRFEIDAAFERLLERLLRADARPAVATHDDRLVERTIALAREVGLGPDRYEFQMLYGVRRDLQARLVAAGFAVRVYVPFGTEWYPYFMRRLAERPANVAFVLRSVLRERRRGSADRGPGRSGPSAPP